MKIGFVTTTINLPVALLLCRKYGPDVRFFVAGDEKTPERADTWCTELPGTVYMSPEFQRLGNWKCSELIGFNNIQRKNIALLEAIKWGADILIFWDDDNIPLDQNYFLDFQKVMLASRSELVLPGNIRHTTDAALFNGIKVTGPNGWLDPGQLLTPTVRHRGLPLHIASMPPELSTITDAKIGVNVGLWVGDADVDATHRIANPPHVVAPSALAEAGVVVDPRTKTVWNAQNAGFIRELAPAMFQAPGIGRADDIFASLITQRVMREHDLHTRIGRPFTACWQHRSTQSKIDDLKQELFLYKHTAEFAEYLDSHIVSDKIAKQSTVLGQVRAIYEDLRGNVDFPLKSVNAGIAFLDDLEGVL